MRWRLPWQANRCNTLPDPGAGGWRCSGGGPGLWRPASSLRPEGSHPAAPGAGVSSALRLTWRALLASLLAGGGLLFLLAVGARVAIAAILSPQERIDRIEKKMAELGENPDGSNPNSPSVQISGRIRMTDGSAAPEGPLDLVSVVKNSSDGTIMMSRGGVFDCVMPAGTIYIGAELSGCALAVIGPLDGRATNRFENLDLVFGLGFDATIQLVDADSGKPVPGGTVSTLYYMRGVGGTTFQTHTLTTEENGSAMLEHAADQPLVVTANAPGYEILEKRFESVQPNKPLRIALRAGAKVSGVVLDKTSAKPIAGATVSVRYEKGPTERGYGWDDAIEFWRRRMKTDGSWRINCGRAPFIGWA